MRAYNFKLTCFIKKSPIASSIFQNWEFEVYDRYAEAFNEDCQRQLNELLSQPDIEAPLSTAGHGFLEAVKFYFPKLLLEPFYHCIQYFEYIKVSTDLTIIIISSK